MKKKIKNFASNSSVKSIDLKEKVFQGEILLTENFDEMENLNKTINNFFTKFFGFTIENFVKDFSLKVNENKLIKFQNLIKESKLVRNKFKNFLKSLGFYIDDTYCDMITLRFSPSNNEISKGLLKPAQAHRDSWASNFQHQINWWIPLHAVSHKNGIYFIPNYFSKPVNNDSDHWSFESYKKFNKSFSTPVSLHKFDKKDYLSKKINYGQALIFSGTHIHGSKIGLQRRINIETRTLCSNDKNLYSIPKNVDNKSRKTRFKWFRSLSNSKIYND